MILINDHTSIVQEFDSYAALLRLLCFKYIELVIASHMIQGHLCWFCCCPNAIIRKCEPQNVDVTSVSKKLGQSAVVYYYCALSQFF